MKPEKSPVSICEQTCTNNLNHQATFEILFANATIFFHISSFLDFFSDVNHSTYLSFMYMLLDQIENRCASIFGCALNLPSYISKSFEVYAII